MCGINLYTSMLNCGFNGSTSLSSHALVSSETCMEFGTFNSCGCVEAMLGILASAPFVLRAVGVGLAYWALLSALLSYGD